MYAESDDPHRDEVLETRIVAADQTFSSARILDLGDRQVELIHPGLGHTAGDLVVRVPDVDVLLAGDLVEESSSPFFGGDCHPFEWPTSLDLVLSLLTDDSAVVPGHGKVVDRAFVHDQRGDLGVVAETIRDLARRGVPLAQALDAAEWPFPRKSLTEAVRRGYDQLPRGGRQLPLLWPSCRRVAGATAATLRAIRNAASPIQNTHQVPASIETPIRISSTGRNGGRK